MTAADSAAHRTVESTTTPAAATHVETPEARRRAPISETTAEGAAGSVGGAGAGGGTIASTTAQTGAGTDGARRRGGILAADRGVQTQTGTDATHLHLRATANRIVPAAPCAAHLLFPPLARTSSDATSDRRPRTPSPRQHPHTTHLPSTPRPRLPSPHRYRRSSQTRRHKPYPPSRMPHLPLHRPLAWRRPPLAD